MSTNASRPKFCMECGTSLPGTAKFCPECGTRVPAAAAETSAPAAEAPTPEVVSVPAPAAPTVPPELQAKFEAAQKELRGDRREVVVLFADLKGFTSMSERLDPEEVSVIMQRLLGELADSVHRYEGYVDKYIGDAIMALFGAPLAHENDAERAVLAALDMLQSVARRNEGAVHTLSLRVGLNLGEVVAAHMGSESRLQYTVMGDTVNVASRLEGAAEPDTILVSRSVYERIASRFDTEEMPPVTVKGKAEPLAVHRVLGLRATPRSASAPRTVFVGREEELEVARMFLDEVAEGTAPPLLIEAEAGAGKSRLIAEALARSSVEFVRAEIAFSQIQIPGQLPPAAELFRGLMEPGDQRPEAIARATEALGSAAEDHRSGIAGLARQAFPGAPDESEPEEAGDPRAARQNRWLALAALLTALGRGRPALVVVEDLHWADEESQELLAHLVSALAGKPVGFILTARPGGRPEWLGDDATALRLQALGEDAARSILGGILDTMRPSVRREIIRRSQGNPLYLEELARSLVGSVEEAARAVPGSVQGLLQSRIDRLDPPIRLALQMGAVLGPQFSVGLLHRMYSLDPQPVAFEDALRALEEQAFVEPTQQDDDTRRFRHALMQEVAYGGILLRLRKVLHESAARLGEEHYAERLEAEAPFFAHHYWEADLREESAPHLFRAAMHAAGQYDLHAAERWFGQLSEVLADFPDVLPVESDRADMMLRHGAVLLDRGRYDAADDLFESLAELGTETERSDWVGQALRYRGQIAALRGRLEESRALFERGLERVPPSEERITADLRTGLGLMLYYGADADGALAQFEAALELYERIHDDLGKSKCYINIGNVLDDLRNDRDAAEPSYERALELIEQVGDRRLKTGVLLNLGTLAMERGNWESALDRFRHVESLAEETGWSFMRFLSLQNQAGCELSLGRLESALGHLEACLREGEPMIKAPDRVRLRQLQFEARLAALDHERAAEKLAEARKVAEEIGIREMEDSLLLDEGRLRLAEGDWEAAWRTFAAALDAAVRLDHPPVAALARAHLHRAAVRSGREGPDVPPETGIEEPARAIVRYLAADAQAITNPGAEAGRALEAAGEVAADLGHLALERAAFERAAAVWDTIGDEEARERAFERAARAMAALEASLPPGLRELFAAHPRNEALRARVPA